MIALEIEQQKKLQPAKFLQDQTLNNKWLVKELIKEIPNGSGGNFSFSYNVIDLDTGISAFLKALDFSTAMRDKNPLKAIGDLRDIFVFEQTILEMCKSKRLSKVVTLLDHGNIEPPVDSIIPVPYFIMELANGNVRGRIDFTQKFNHLLNLNILHNTAVGLSQLHKIGISHQDIKPSNILVFDDKKHKIGDLGRADTKAIDKTPFGHLDFAGDLGYAPPEALYRNVAEDWVFRRLACDAYQLGSLIVFLYTNNSLTALLKLHINPQHNWHNWEQSYEEVIPYINIAMEQSIDYFKTCVDDAELANELSALIFQLCHPNPFERGQPKKMATKRTTLSLEQYISILSRMINKYEIKFLSKI